MDLHVCEICAERLIMFAMPRASDKLPSVRRILHEKLGLASGYNTNLRHVDFFGTVFRLVDGVWSEGAS
jgi:hypothetical protein